MPESESGTRFTVCAEVDCPDLVTIGGCWCWEHLEVCQEHDCEHPAHDCDAPVHYCERHQETA